jgi:hypothetical protein
MKIAGIREIRSNTAKLLGGNEAVLVTRHGNVSGLYLPLGDADRIPQGLRRELRQMLSTHLAEKLAAVGRTEEEIQLDFDAFRRRRR